jgi:hypothetical protein
VLRKVGFKMSRELIGHIIEKVREIPTRVEALGGQNYKYVRLEEVVDLLQDINDEQAKQLSEPVEPLSKWELAKATANSEYKTMEEKLAFIDGVKFAEEKHGITDPEQSKPQSNAI